MVATRSRQRVGNPRRCNSSRRKSHLTESNALAMSSYRKRVRVLFLLHILIMLCTAMQLSWIDTPCLDQGTLARRDNLIHARGYTKCQSLHDDINKRVDLTYWPEICHSMCSFFLWYEYYFCEVDDLQIGAPQVMESIGNCHNIFL